MAPKKNPQPEWITDLIESTVAELIEHARARIASIEQEHRGKHHEGQLAPALVLALQTRLKAELDQEGLAAVQAYTEARRKQGTPAQEAQGEELGPLLGLSRAGVYHAFGRRA